MSAPAAQERDPRARRSFSARARRAVFLRAHGYSRMETAALIGVRPETISLWKSHPQWQLELERWRALAAEPPELRQRRLQRQALAVAEEALQQLCLIMERATKQVHTSGGIEEVPDWSTRQMACVLAIANFFAVYWELSVQEGKAPGIGRTLRIVP